MTDIDIINLYKDKKYKYLKILSNEMLKREKWQRKII